MSKVLFIVYVSHACFSFKNVFLTLSGFFLDAWFSASVFLQAATYVTLVACAFYQHLISCNWTRTQSHLVRKRTLNHLAKLVWVFVYELSASGFESSCSHLNFRFRACFEQGVPWHSGNMQSTWFPNYLNEKNDFYRYGDLYNLLTGTTNVAISKEDLLLLLRETIIRLSLPIFIKKLTEW